MAGRHLIYCGSKVCSGRAGSGPIFICQKIPLTQVFLGNNCFCSMKKGDFQYHFCLKATTKKESVKQTTSHTMRTRGSTLSTSSTSKPTFPSTQLATSTSFQTTVIPTTPPRVLGNLSSSLFHHFVFFIFSPFTDVQILSAGGVEVSLPVLSLTSSIIDLLNTNTLCDPVPQLPFAYLSSAGFLKKPNQPMICGGGDPANLYYSRCASFINGSWISTYSLQTPRLKVK